MIDPLGDGISSVELVDHMGDDLTVVNAARVSMAKHSYELDEKDKRLINYLAKHGHWTPFAQPQLQFRIKAPVFLTRQWFKHQISFTRNETSRRYISEEPEVYTPKVWRQAPTDGIKQGSGEAFDEKKNLFLYIKADRLMRTCVQEYNSLIRAGVAPEQARLILPQSMYTEFYETASLYAYARLCSLRLKPDAQWETRQYAEAVSSLIREIYPISWEALNG